jgi:hypothetical protein
VDKKIGTVYYINETARAIRDSKRKTLFYDGIVEDITEHKRLDNVLHESEKLFKELFDKTLVIGFLGLIPETIKNSIVRKDFTDLNI